MDKNTTNLVILAVVIGAIVYLGGGGQFPALGPAAAVGPGAQISQPTVALSGNPNLIVPIADSVTGQTQYGTVYLKTGTTDITNAANTGAGASISNLTPNATYDAVIVAPSENGAFYTVKTTLTAPAGGSKIADPIKVKSRLTTVPSSFTCYKSDDVTTMTGSAPESLAANETKTIRCRLRTASTTNDNNYFSVYQPVIVCDLNSQAIASLQFREGSTSLSASGLPNGHQPFDTNRTSSVAAMMALTSIKSSTDTDIYVTMKATSIDPVNLIDSNGAIACQIYDAALVLNTLTNDYQVSYRNPNTLADIGSGNYKFTVNYS